MENNDIKALINKYQLVAVNGNLRTYARVNKSDFMRDVAPHKGDIIAYLEAEEKSKHDKRAREEADFNAIPGVVEISKARSQAAAWKSAFNRMMETGSSKMPDIERLTPAEMADLEAKYPMAVFALDAKYLSTAARSPRLRAIWEVTYDAIKDGKDLAEIKADHDRRMDEYTKSVIFD